MDIPIINIKMDKYEISTSDIFNISLTINIKIMVYIIANKYHNWCHPSNKYTLMAYTKKDSASFFQLTASYRNIKTDQTEYIKIYFLIDFIYFVLELLLKK